jgi:CheY-like chemotaxis protein
MATVICIEDEDGIRELIAEELTDAGHNVIEAVNGKQGLDLILQQRPDLVVSDWLMPEMSGGELLKALKQDYPQFADVPFLLVSAFVDKARVDQALGSGADAYLTKPIDFDLLLETVDDLLAGK